MAEEQLVPLDWPRNGVNLLKGFGAQQPGTTPSGTNVRTFEAITQRGRGGSRPGIVKYPLGQLPNGSHLVQHLNYIVDPAAEALSLNIGMDPPVVSDPSTNPPGSFFNDFNPFGFRNNGNVWRNGGSGIQPNRNLTIVQNTITGTVVATPDTLPPDGTTGTVTVTVLRGGSPAANKTVHINTSPSGRTGDGSSGVTNSSGQVSFTVSNTMSETVTYTGIDDTDSVTLGSDTIEYSGWRYIQSRQSTLSGQAGAGTFTSDVAEGHLIIAFGFRVTPITATPSISDSQGNTYTAIQLGFNYNSPLANRVDLWFAYASSDGPLTVTYTTDSGSVGGLLIAEYAGTSLANPVAFSTATGSAGTVTSPEPLGVVTVSGTDEAILAMVFNQDLGTPQDINGSMENRESGRFILSDLLGTNSTYQPTMTFAGGTAFLGYGAICISLQHA